MIRCGESYNTPDLNAEFPDSQGPLIMTQFDQRYFENVTAAVERVETRTSAELVVAVYPQSGRYRDVDYLVGAIFAFVWLLFAVFNPWFVHPGYVIPFEAAVLFGVGVLTGANVPALRLYMTTKRRRDRQVRDAAASMFVADGVGNTRERTGVLIYLSRLERQLEVIADIGIVDTITPEDWSECLFALHNVGTADDPAEALLVGIDRLGDLLAKTLPAGEDNPDEIPNHPRVSP